MVVTHLQIYRFGNFLLARHRVSGGDGIWSVLIELLSLKSVDPESELDPGC